MVCADKQAEYQGELKGRDPEIVPLLTLQTKDSDAYFSTLLPPSNKEQTQDERERCGDKGGDDLCSPGGSQYEEPCMHRGQQDHVPAPASRHLFLWDAYRQLLMQPSMLSWIGKATAKVLLIVHIGATQGYLYA